MFSLAGDGRGDYGGFSGRQAAGAAARDVPIHCIVLSFFDCALLQATDATVAEGLTAAGLQVRQHATYLLREPGEVRVDMDRWCGHFGTLTPFDRRVFQGLSFHTRTCLGVHAHGPLVRPLWHHPDAL